MSGSAAPASAAAAIELGLVDELRMFRYPVVVGGTPFLPPVTEDVPLDLIETRTFAARDLRAAGGRATSRTDAAVRSSAPRRGLRRGRSADVRIDWIGRPIRRLPRRRGGILLNPNGGSERSVTRGSGCQSADWRAPGRHPPLGT